MDLPEYGVEAYAKQRRNTKRVAEMDAMLPRIGSSENLEEDLEEVSGKSPEQLTIEASNRYEENTISLDGDILAEAAFISETDPALALSIGEKVKQGREADKGKTELYKAILDNLLSTPGAENLTKPQIDYMASNQLLMYGIANELDELGAWGWTKNIANLIVLPDLIWNIHGVSSKLKEEFGLDIDAEMKTSVADIVGLSNFRKRLGAEERQLFDNRFLQILEELESNPIQKAHMIGLVTGDHQGLGLDVGLERAEILLTVGTLGISLINRVLKTSQIVKRLADSGDHVGAVKASEVLARDPEAAVVAGQSQFDAANITNPLANPEIFPGSVAGRVSDNAHYDPRIDDVLVRARNVADIDLAEADPDAAVRVAAAIRKHLPDNMQLERVSVGLEDGVTTVRYSLIDETGAQVGPFTQPYLVDDIGRYIDPDVGLGSNVVRMAVSPAYVQGLDATRLVDSALVGVLGSAKIASVYTEAAELALKPIKYNKKSLLRVNRVLELLDGEDVIPSRHLLMDVGVGGNVLSEVEFQAFHGIRRILDDLHVQNNRVIREELMFQNARTVRVGDETFYAKSYGDPISADGAWRNDSDNIRLLRADTGEELRGLSLKDLEDYYEQGFVLTRSHYDDTSQWFRGVSKSSDAPYYRFALVRGDDIGEIPMQVLNKIPNYLPKWNKGANFFVKEKRLVDAGGRMPEEKWVTIGYASTRTQAMKGMEGTHRLDLELGKKPRILEIKEDEKMDVISTADASKSMGGLIRGQRASEEIIDFNKTGGGRADVLESLQRAIGVTADKLPMSRWRMAAREEWRNSAKHHFEKLPDNWEEARAHVANSSQGALKTKLLNAHDQISAMSNIPTQSEKFFRGTIISAAKSLDKFDNPVFQRAAAFMYEIKDNNPINMMKSITFNLTLGAFSMVQIPVQMFGALVALSANPVYASRAMGSWLMASGLDLGKDMKVVNDTAIILGRRMGMAPETVKSFQNDYAFWRASGMRESVVRGNADATALMNGMPLDAGLLRRGWAAAVNAGQTPYRVGELGNMRISFFTALERQKELDGAKFVYNDSTMSKVLSRAEKYRLGMNVANKAAYQKGIWSLPTQFKQIYTKYIEALTGRAFTPAEKLRILGVQATVFGAAGIPIMNHFVDEIIRSTGMTDELSAQDLVAMKTGVLGLALRDFTDIAVTGRLTVSADLFEELKKMSIEGRTPVLELMAGASASPLKYGLGFFNNLILAGNLVYDTDELDPAVLAGAMEITAQGLLSMSASGRKAIEARDLHYGWVRTADGRPLYQVSDPKSVDIFFRAMGFGSQEKEEFYKQMMINLDIKQERAGRVLQLYNAWFTLANGLNNDDREKVKRAQIALSMINSQIDNMPVREAMRVRDDFHKRVLNPKDAKEKVISEAIEVFYWDSLNKAKILTPLIREAMESRDAQGRQFIQEANDRRGK